MYLQVMLEFSCFWASVCAMSWVSWKSRFFCSKLLRLILRLGPSALLCC